MTASRETSCRRLLVSDIDGTLLEDGKPTPGLLTLRKLIEKMRDSVCLVYATGRTYGSTRELVDRDILPEPDGIAPLVGSEVWLPPWNHPDPGYERFILAGWNRRSIREQARGLSDLVEQPSRYQSPRKLSYFTSSEKSVQTLRQMLSERGIEAKVVYSGSRYLDVLPCRAGKNEAAMWIRCRCCRSLHFWP